MNRAKPVLFLDVDGVLHPFNGDKHHSQVTTFHRDCMQHLQHIVSATNAEIVLSSSWRNFASMRNRLQANLSEYDLSFNRWVEPDSVSSDTRSVSGQKMSKILSFVMAYNPSEWAVVDDEDLVALGGIDPSSVMVQLFSFRFVHTDASTGLTKVDAEQIINLLKS